MNGKLLLKDSERLLHGQPAVNDFAEEANANGHRVCRFTDSEKFRARHFISGRGWSEFIAEQIRDVLKIGLALPVSAKREKGEGWWTEKSGLECLKAADSGFIDQATAGRDTRKLPHQLFSGQEH